MTTGCYVCGLETVNEQGWHVCPAEVRLEMNETQLLIELDTYDNQHFHRASKTEIEKELEDVQATRKALAEEQERKRQYIAELGFIKPANWNNPTKMGTWEDEMIDWLESFGIRYVESKCNYVRQ